MSGSISCNDTARRLLGQAIAGEPLDRELIAYLATHECSESLFRILAEGLADRFDPKLTDDYAAIFAEAIAPLLPPYSAGDLQTRFERVRRMRVCRSQPKRVVVLSRVTLGADIAITSVLLETAKERFPHAEIYLAGDAKAAELFAQDSRIRHLEARYPRNGSLAQCLESAQELRKHLDGSDTIVIDPDSRLTQLGLVPICDEERYFFFESRSYRSETSASLAQLARQWAGETFEVDAPLPRISPPDEPIVLQHPAITVSLGVGGNNVKRLSESFESGLLRLLSETFSDVVVDRGFGNEENSRVDRLLDGLPARPWTGSFARFASVISKSNCYLGYDSAGQHAAAAFGCPLVTLFKGFASDRMFDRWQPTGPGPKAVLKVCETAQLQAVTKALASFSFRKA